MRLSKNIADIISSYECDGCDVKLTLTRSLKIEDDLLNIMAIQTKMSI